MSDANDTIEDFLIDALIAGGKMVRAIRPYIEVESSTTTLTNVDKEIEINNTLVFSAVKSFVIEQVNGN